MLSDHQKSILNFLRTVESASKEEIYNNSSLNYYHNWQKHAGDVLSRMVKLGIIKRIKRGSYAISDKAKQTPNKTLDLFNIK